MPLIRQVELSGATSLRERRQVAWRHVDKALTELPMRFPSVRLGVPEPALLL